MYAVTDYAAAKSLGESAVRKAIKNGRQPYLPVLDQILEADRPAGEIHLGLMELPIDRISGNKEASRSNAFANNFMPILDASSEFGQKWMALYDSFKEEGIRDAIKCYEYMNRYYVQEGNKRVSVSKFGGSDFILADVTRILPVRNDSKESRVYFEYLDFYNATGNFYIIFNEPGEYQKLAELLEQDLEHKWPQELCNDLKTAYFKFCSASGVENDPKIGEAFLVYLTVHPLKTILDDTKDQIGKNMMRLRDEILVSINEEKIAFLGNTGENEPDSNAKINVGKSFGISNIGKLLRRGEIGKLMNTDIDSLFSIQPRKYTPDDPLRAAFIYDMDIESSRWINSHEAGRLYLDETIGSCAVSKSYMVKIGETVTDTLERVIEEGADVIFTVRPDMMEETFRIAVKYPDVRFFNCSMGSSISSVRCYQGKLYEAAFLMGILAADMTIREGGSRIGYLSYTDHQPLYPVLNAFAVGASIISPDCRISLRYGSYEECRRRWQEEGISVFADIEYADSSAMREPGVFRIEGSDDKLIGRPYYSWGRFYQQMIRSILSGTYYVSDIMNEHKAVNYWFGMSAGVVDIFAPDLPYQTKKLLSFFKNAIVNGIADPFSGELRSQNGTVQEQVYEKKNSIPSSLSSMDTQNIVSMDWLNENIDEPGVIY